MEPWQMTREEFVRTLQVRVDQVPSVSFDEWFLQQGGNRNMLTQERDIANFVGGAFAESTSHGRGKLRGIADRIQYENVWLKRYHQACLDGSIPMKKVTRALSDSEADRAYARIRHRRAVTKALLQGLAVPDEVLIGYPELARTGS